MSETLWVVVFEDGKHVKMQTNRFFLYPPTGAVAIIRQDYFDDKNWDEKLSAWRAKDVPQKSNPAPAPAELLAPRVELQSQAEMWRKL